MSEPKRNHVTYITSDRKNVAILDFPFGLISTPTIDFPVPRVGTMTFYHASGYCIPVPRHAEFNGLET